MILPIDFPFEEDLMKTFKCLIGLYVALMMLFGSHTLTAAEEKKVDIKIPAGDSPFLLAGAAAENITPKPGVKLGGYGFRIQPSVGVRSELFARVLYLQKGEQRVLWLVCDLLGFDRDDVELIQNQLADSLGLAPSSIIVSATHTHSAPAVQAIGPEKQTEYLRDLLLPKILKAGQRAAASAVPCRMITVEGKSKLAHDRRNDPRPGDGGAPNPDRNKACIDERVPAVAFQKEDGSYQAILIQYAMHPTSHGDLYMGSEWPGATAIAVKKTFGESVEPFVLQGGAGNLGSPKRKASPEEMQAWGDELVAAVADKIRKTPPLKNAVLEFGVEKIRVALATVDPDAVRKEAQEYRKVYASKDFVIDRVVNRWESLQLERLKNGTADHLFAETAVVRLGDEIFITTPFEMFCHMNGMVANCLKRHVHIIGYTNGVYNYFPTSDAVDQGGYEPKAYLWYLRFPCAKDALETYSRAAAELVRKTVKLQ